MRSLIFGTTYCADEAAFVQVQRWSLLHRALNPNCDLLLVDSASPVFPTTRLDPSIIVTRLSDNIGHLARRGQDGWGRAFCEGLQFAQDGVYDYVAHVEGDSLCRLHLEPIFEEMSSTGKSALSPPVRGTRLEGKGQEVHWVETGLMLFSVDWLHAADVVRRYDWRDAEPKRRYPLTPEWWLRRIIGSDLTSWDIVRAARGDCGQITEANVDQYDWITHVEPTVADAFVESALRG